MSSPRITLISIGTWFVEGLAGIRSDWKSPGFKRFVVTQNFVSDFVKDVMPRLQGDRRRAYVDELAGLSC